MNKMAYFCQKKLLKIFLQAFLDIGKHKRSTVKPLNITLIKKPISISKLRQITSKNRSQT